MGEYRISVVVGRLDQTWYRVEVTYISDDNGDAAAMRAGEQQVINTLNAANVAVAFVFADTIDIIEDEDKDWPWDASDDPEFYGTHNMNEHNDAWAEAQPGYDGNDGRDDDAE